VAKGFFTQGAAVLFSAAPTLDVLAELLPEALARKPAAGHWALGGPTLILPLRPEVNGLFAVDVVDRPWPDGMGDPKEDTELFAAWSMGHFGPNTFPGNLERAKRQSWISEAAPALVERHRAFVRVRASYIFGAADDAAVLPPDHDPMDELRKLTAVAGKLLHLPDALLYFNPNGEVICDRETFEASAAVESHAPLDLWSNVRMWNVGDGFFVMDTLGLGQLDFVDHEAVFRRDHVEPRDVARFLRNLSLYSVDQRPTFEDGNTTDGPGGIWRVKSFQESAVAPPRPVLRWALDGEKLPEPLR
jgi:hypothetical protein